MAPNFGTTPKATAFMPQARACSMAQPNERSKVLGWMGYTPFKGCTATLGNATPL